MVSLPNTVHRVQFVQTPSLYKACNKLLKGDEGRASKFATVFNFTHSSMFMSNIN